MSEIRRAQLISFGPDHGSGGGGDKKKTPIITKSVRLQFALSESNEGTCPIYNYKEELTNAKKKDKSAIKGDVKSTQPNGLDPFDENDDDVRRIALEFEAKYGGATTTKKKRKGRKDDYADIGMGYDESDSFIDNTDGYDEIIPQNVTTLHGGFYINCGALEFKTDDEASSEISSSSSSESSEDEEEDEEDDKDEKKMKKEKSSRKRILETSESEGDTETEKNDKKLHKKHKLSNGIRKPKIVSGDESNHKSDKEQKTDKELKTIKEPKPDKEKIKKRKRSTSTSSRDKSPATKENKNPAEQSSRNDITITPISNGAKMEQKVDLTLGDDDISFNATNVMRDTESNKSQSSIVSTPKLELVQLPENLPSNILATINRLKELAARSTESTNKLSTTEANATLMNLERKCRCLGKPSRSRIYQHLAYHAKSTKEALIRRAKALCLKDDQKHLSNLVSELQMLITSEMPALLEGYDREVAYKRSKEALMDGTDESKQIRMPKRKYPWHDRSLKLLKDIICIRRRCFAFEGVPKEHLDNKIQSYLKSTIQVLWPEGWMTMPALQKQMNTFNDRKFVSAPPMPPLQPKPMLSSKHETIKEPVKSLTVRDLSNSCSKEIQKLSSNSMLSITPIDPTGESPPKPKVVQKNDLTINAVEISKLEKTQLKPEAEKSVESTTTQFINLSHASEVSIKPIKPPTDHKIENIMKPDLVIKPIPESAGVGENNRQESLQRQVKKSESSDESDVIIVEDGITRETKKDNSDKSVEVMDLTNKSHSTMGELKRKPAPKCKTKYYDSSKAIKPVKSAYAESKKAFDSSFLDNLFQENIAETETYYKSSRTASNHIAASSSSTSLQPSASATSHSSLPQPAKHSNSGEDDNIQNVMESLKLLQNLSAPIKSEPIASSSSQGSPVSVIAYNNKYSSISPPKSRNDELLAAAALNFQQQQFLNDFKNSLMSSSASSTPGNASKGYNAAHTSTAQSMAHQLHYTNANNNYSQQQNKYKSNYSAQPPGSFNIMDDMLANILSEYAYPKSANHKPPKSSSSQK